MPGAIAGTIVSQALGMEKGITLLLPPGYDDPAQATTRYPAIYFIHGFSGDQDSWLAQTDIAGHLCRLAPHGVIGVFVDVDKSYGVDALEPYPGAGAYRTHFFDEVVPYVDQHFRTIARQDGRAISGFSMGGYIALYLPLDRPDLFCSAASHSGAVLFGHGETHPSPNVRLRELVGPPNHPRRAYTSVLRLLMRRWQEHRSGAVAWVWPHLSLDCSRDEIQVWANRAILTVCESFDIPLRYVDGAGPHGWETCDTLAPGGIRHHLQALAQPER